MKKMFLLAATLCATGCWGYSSQGNEAIGQVKRVHHNTPLFCPNWDNVDLSLGVMQNGVGSMSTQDQWFVVNDPSLLATAQQAAQTGKLVTFEYRVDRWYFCADEPEELTRITIKQ